MPTKSQKKPSLRILSSITDEFDKHLGFTWSEIAIGEILKYLDEEWEEKKRKI